MEEEKIFNNDFTIQTKDEAFNKVMKTVNLDKMLDGETTSKEEPKTFLTKEERIFIKMGLNMKFLNKPKHKKKKKRR